MGQRSVRVNELLKREISQILHTRYQTEAVAITISDVDISPDLRNGSVYYSVIGNEAVAREAQRFFARNATEIKHYVGKTVTLKYLPKLRFIQDDSLERGSRMMDILDEIEEEDTR